MDEARREMGYGMITLMSGVEYAVRMDYDWEERVTDKWVKVFKIDGKTPFWFNTDGVLMIRPATKEEFDKWVSKQEQLIKVQEIKLEELIKNGTKQSGDQKSQGGVLEKL